MGKHGFRLEILREPREIKLKISVIGRTNRNVYSSLRALAQTRVPQQR